MTSDRIKRGISFDCTIPISDQDPYRMDVACFVGFVPLRQPNDIPGYLNTWLKRYGWLDRVKSNTDEGNDHLLDVPVPIESWEQFSTLFAGEKRLSGRAAVSSEALKNTLSVPSEDTTLMVVIDGSKELIHIDAVATLNEVESSINTQMAGGNARIRSTGNSEHLVISRTITPGRAGELTVYANKSLGFPRTVSSRESYLDTYLAGAVRSFFLRGGRKCYVVRMGDPPPLDSSETDRIIHLARLLFGSDGSIWGNGTVLDNLKNIYLPNLAGKNSTQKDWHGIAHLLGLEDVSFVCLPDLPDLLSETPVSTKGIAETRHPEIFVECTPEIATTPEFKTSGWQAPRCTETGYEIWSRILRYLIDFIKRISGEVQLVAAIPLPAVELDQEFESFVQENFFSKTENSDDLSSAFLQLSFPWLKTRQANALPGGLETPEGTLLGIIADNTLTKGAYKSVAGATAGDAYDIWPVSFDSIKTSPALSDKISTFSYGFNGIELKSDVTTSPIPAYQPASVCRLTAYILRASRTYGLSSIFEPLSEATWRDVKTNLSILLRAIFENGAFRGTSEKEAFHIACGHDTMTKNDMDNGRLIAHISFQPAQPIERIHINLAIEDQGRVLIQGRT